MSRSYLGDAFGNPLPLFDTKQAQLERDKAIALVSRRKVWVEEFRTAIMSCAARMDTFTSDDVLEMFPSLEECKEKRVAGAAFNSLKNRKLIVPLGYRKSSRVASHARPKRVWKLS